MSAESPDLNWETDKAAYRSHVDALVAAYAKFGAPWPRRHIVRDLRDRSVRRLIEEVGHDLTPQQRASLDRYRRIMEELERECDN